MLCIGSAGMKRFSRYNPFHRKRIFRLPYFPGKTHRYLFDIPAARTALSVVERGLFVVDSTHRHRDSPDLPACHTPGMQGKYLVDERQNLESILPQHLSPQLSQSSLPLPPARMPQKDTTIQPDTSSILMERTGIPAGRLPWLACLFVSKGRQRIDSGCPARRKPGRKYGHSGNDSNRYREREWVERTQPKELTPDASGRQQRER